MGFVSLSLPTDGTTADVADYNTPLTTLKNEFNGSIDNSNLKSTAAIDPTKLSGGSANMFTVWQTWTPTLTNVTIGNGTTVAKYNQIGKTVHFKITITFGSTTSVGASDTMITLPVTAASDYATNKFYSLVGNGAAYDSSASSYYSLVTNIYSTTQASVNVQGAAGSFTALAGVSNTQPFTWAVADVLYFTGTYEAA